MTPDVVDRPSLTVPSFGGSAIGHDVPEAKAESVVSECSFYDKARMGRVRKSLPKQSQKEHDKYMRTVELEYKKCRKERSELLAFIRDIQADLSREATSAEPNVYARKDLDVALEAYGRSKLWRDALRKELGDRMKLFEHGAAPLQYVFSERNKWLERLHKNTKLFQGENTLFKNHFLSKHKEMKRVISTCDKYLVQASQVFNRTRMSFDA